MEVVKEGSVSRKKAIRLLKKHNGEVIASIKVRHSLTLQACWAFGPDDSVESSIYDSPQSSQILRSNTTIPIDKADSTRLSDEESSEDAPADDNSSLEGSLPDSPRSPKVSIRQHEVVKDAE